MKIIENQEIINQEYYSYLSDESKIRGQASAIVIPDNEAELKAFIRDYNSREIPITVTNGRTGITGGAVPNNTVLVSLEKFNSIMISDTVLTVGCSVSLQQIDDYLKGNKLLLIYPVDVTEMSSRIGGNIAVDASGSRSYFYGSTRKWIRRLKILLADGKILDIPRGKWLARGNELVFEKYVLQLPDVRKPDVKDVSGYYIRKDMDLIDLFIGSEGTLGIILEADLQLVKRPENITAMVCFFKEEDQALDFFFDFFSKIKQAYCFEFFDKNSLSILKNDFSLSDFKGAIYLELILTDENCIILDNALQAAGSNMDNTWAGDDEKKMQRIKSFRHQLPERINQMIAENQRNFPGLHKVGTDIAVPMDKLMEMISYYRQVLNENPLAYCLFGHIGEAHLHLNMIPADQREYLNARKLLTLFIKKAVSLGGTFTAEHGVGRLKKEYMNMLYSPEELRMFIKIKEIFDPKGILNPGVMF